MPQDKLTEFRSFVIKKNPNISKTQLKELDDFIQQEQAAQLVGSGQLGFKEALDPNAVALASRLVQAGKQIPQDTDVSADEAKQKSKLDIAARTINQLERQYFGEDRQPGLLNDVGKGKVLGLIPYLANLVGLAPRVRTYLTSKEAARPQLARAAGEVGALTEQEQEAAIANLPGVFSTPTEAYQGFEALKERLGITPEMITQAALMQNQQPQIPRASQTPQTPQVTITDPRVQEALNAGYTMDEIQQFLQGR